MHGPRPSSLSVCCLVRDPPLRVVSILETLRAVADEIVIAVDSAAPGADSPALAAAADQLYRVPFEPPFERYLPWLHSLCSAEWIFRIDGDEIPGAALIESLPALIHDPRVLQYRLPRRWLLRDADQWLDCEPWCPDYQIRIVRNDPATLRFRGTLHSSAEPVLPARYLTEPIYHLALLVTSRAEREERVRQYEALPDSTGHVDNAGFYLPELRESVSFADTPPEDKALVERVVSERIGPPAARQTVTARDVSLAEVLRLWPPRELEAEAYDIEITCLVDGPRFVAPETRTVDVLLRNRGAEWFPWGDWRPPVRVAYHWLSVDGETVVHEGQRTLLTSDLLAGQEVVLPLVVVPPQDPGRYILEIDLVHEGVRWFGCSTRVSATVEAGA